MTTTYRKMDPATRTRLAKALQGALGRENNPLAECIEFLDFTNDTEVEIDRAIRDIEEGVEPPQEEQEEVA